MNERELNIRKTIFEMFQQRGYTDIQKDDDNITAFKPDGKGIYAFCSIVDKLNVNEINGRIDILQKQEIAHGIIIYEGTPTSVVKSIIANMPDIDMNIELFSADDLQFNITKHYLVPQHIRLSKEEAKNFKEKYDAKNIPVLLRTDPVAKFYDFSKGDIVKIIRKGGFVSYRIVH